MKIAGSFYPFSNQFHANRDFKKLNAGQKMLTVVVTVLAAIASAPILCLGGVAAFRAMVRKYTFSKFDPKKPDKDPDIGISSVKKGETARKAHRFAAMDDGILGLKPKVRKKLYDLDEIVVSKQFIRMPESEEQDPSVVSDDSEEEASEEGSTASDQSEEFAHSHSSGQDEAASSSGHVHTPVKDPSSAGGCDNGTPKKAPAVHAAAKAQSKSHQKSASQDQPFASGDPEEGVSEDSSNASCGLEEPCSEPALVAAEEVQGKSLLPDAGEQAVSAHYEKALQGLEEANSRLDKIAKMEPTQQNAQGFLSKWWYGEQAEEPEHNLGALAESVDKIAQLHQAFLEADIPPDKGPKGVEHALAEHKACLAKAFESMMKLKADYAKKGNSEAEKHIVTLMHRLDDLQGALPEYEEPSSIEESGRSFLGKLAGAFFETGNPDEIGWKVKKYEAQLLELKRCLNQRFGKSLTDEDAEAASLKKLLYALNSFTFEKNEKVRLSQDYLTQVRDFYNKAFLGELREALIKDPDNPLLLGVCELLFASLDLERECYEIVDLFDQIGAKRLGQKLGEVDPSSPGAHPFVQRIHTLYHRIHSAPYSIKAPLFNQWGNSARGQWNKNFDPYCQGNPVHVLYHLYIGKKDVKSLGMGTPTIEDSSGTASLSPEFIGFGKAYQKQGKKHLFVLNQNSIPKNGMVAWLINGDETARCNLILDSQEREDLKGAVYCIGLAKNSPFYSQTGEFSSRDDAILFKQALHGQIFELPREVSGCFIPESIKKAIPELEVKAQEIMDGIHTYLFSGKEKLSVHERKQFIEIYYDTLTKLIMCELEVDSFNISCKDAIDRGAGSNAQLFANCAVALQGELSSAQQKKAEMLMMVRALLVRKRAPIHERVERFAETVDHALSNADGMQKLHQSVFNKKLIIPV